jgi:hypothetical protein
MATAAKLLNKRSQGLKKGSAHKVKKTKQVLKQKRQSHERGTGLKFNASSYELISKFTAKTRVKYAPNPKTPGSKSFVRYAKYEKSKTVGDALKHCKPADLLWEYERGYLKVLGGPMADVPACMAPPSKDPVIQILAKFRGPNGCSIKMDPEVRKKLAQLAVEFGLNLDKIHEEAGKQCNSESADIQTARVIANELARRKLEAKRTIEDKDIAEVLSVWGFPENDTRLNVLPEGVKTVHSDTLGVLKMRDGTYRVFDPTTRYEHVTRMITQWFVSKRGKDIPSDFGFTGININHNYAGRRHRDNGNEGPSVIKAIGKFTGGKLNYFPKDVKKPGRVAVTELDPKESIAFDLMKDFVLFNGNNAHGVQPFKGNRFSLVFFTTSKWWKMQKKEVSTLKRLGFHVPTESAMNQVKKNGAKVDEERAKKL